MPRIQDYNRRVTIPDTIPNAQMNVGTAGLLGEGAAKVGNALENLGGAIAQRVEHQRKEDLHNSSLRIGDLINNEQIDFEVGEKAKLGQDAYGSQDRVAAWQKTTQEKYLNGITDPDLRNNLQHHINAKALSLKGALASHEAQQRSVVTEQTNIATLDTQMKAARLQSGTLEDNINEFSKAIGASPSLSAEEKTNKIMAGQSAIAEARLESLMTNNPAEAKRLLESGYFNQYLSGKSLDRLRPEIDKFLNYENGRAAGDEVFNNNIPRTMNDPINVDAMRKQIPSTLNESAKAIAEKRIEEKAKELHAARTEKVNLYVDNLWQRIDDKQLGLTSALKDVDTADLPGDTRVKLKKQVEHYFKPPKDPEAVLLKKIGQMEKLADLQEKISNGELRVQSLKDGLRYAGDIGRENVGKLVSFGKNYEKALATPALAPGQFDVVIEELRNSGVKDIPKKGKPEYKAMQATLLDELVTRQTATGKVLDDAGVKSEFRRILTTKIPVNAKQTFLGIPLYSTTDEKRQWEIQNPQAVDIKGLLRSSLKREPTDAEVKAAESAYLKKSTRRDTKVRASIGGGYGAE